MLKVSLLFLSALLCQWAHGIDIGVTDCSGTPAVADTTSDKSTNLDTDTGQSFIVEDDDFRFGCCGAVSEWRYYAGATGTLTFQIWRRTSATVYTLVGEVDHVVASTGAGTYTPADNERLTFKEGDFIGWYTAGAEIISYNVDLPVMNRKAAIGDLATGATNDWSTADVQARRWYGIQAVHVDSMVPYFKNLPARLEYADTAVTSSGVNIITVSVGDPDPDDVAGLTVGMYADWDRYFSFEVNTKVLTTARQLTPGTYTPVFIVEEQHCGKTATASLTITVSDSFPSITNLPAHHSLSEGMLGETILYTVTVTDPTSQRTRCKGDWTIGTGAGNVPFIVKPISYTAGTHGIYVIEWPELDFTTTSTYDLTVKCYDTFENEVSGKFFVNIVENEKPIFTNLGNSVQVDATQVITGSTIFNVTTVDSEGDQVTLSYTVNDASSPFALYQSGEVRVKQNLYLWNGVTTFIMTITASDADNTIAARELTIYIVNNNNAPVLTNVVSGTTSVTVPENTAVGTSRFAVAITDADSTDTHTYSMTINPADGYRLFEINSTSGVISTHSSNVIDYDVLAVTSFTMAIRVHDGKAYGEETLALTVTNVNEAPTFDQAEYYIVNGEGLNGGSLQSAHLSIDDPDTGDTHTFTLDCGSYSSNFAMAAATGAITFNGDYSLDAGLLPDSHTCTVTVTDAAGLQATATLYIKITQSLTNTPVFNPAVYSVSVSAGTVVGTSILQTTVTDGDVGDTLTYTLSDDSNFFITSSGTVYVGSDLTSFSSGATQSLTITVTDANGNSATAALNVDFPSSTTVVTTTTDRNRKFTEDVRNIAWFAVAMILCACALGVVIYVVVQAVRSMKGPLFTCFRMPKKPRDPNRRWQRRLRGPSNAVNSEVSTNRVTVSEMSDYSDDDADLYVDNDPWEKGKVGPVLQSRAPVMNVTQPKAKDREYFDPHKKPAPKKRSSSPPPPSPSVAETMATASHVISPSPDISLEDNGTSRKSPIRVQSSPEPFDSTSLDD